LDKTAPSSYLSLFGKLDSNAWFDGEEVLPYYGGTDNVTHQCGH